MFENAYIGVDDKNGKPVHNGDKITPDIEGHDEEYQVIWDQECCTFLLHQLGLSFTLNIPIISYVMSNYYVVVDETTAKVGA